MFNFYIFKNQLSSRVLGVIHFMSLLQYVPPHIYKFYNKTWFKLNRISPGYSRNKAGYPENWLITPIMI